MGNLVENPADPDAVHRLRASPNRVRVSGRATITDDPASSARYPGAQFVVHVAVDEVFPNCPRYIHRMDVARAVADRARRRRRGADRRVEVRAVVMRRARRRRPGPCADDSPGGRSSPSARRSSSAPARRTTTTTRPPRRPSATTSTHERRHDESRDDGADAGDDAPRRPRRSPADPFALGVCAGRPRRARRSCCGPGSSATSPTRSTWRGRSPPTTTSPTVTATGTVTATRRRRPQRARRRRRSPGPSWYRFRAGGFTSPVGRAAPVAPARRCGSPRRRASTARPASTPPTATSPSGRPTSSCSSATSSTRAPPRPVGDGRVRSHDGPEPTDLAGYRARYAQYLSDPDLQASRAACPWCVDLGRPRGREQLRRPRPAGPRRAATFAARRAAAYRAWWEHMPVRLPRAGRRRRHDISRPLPLRRPRRPRPARRPPVPQRPGVRRRRRCRPTRRAPRRSTRRARCSATPRRRGWPTTLAASTATWTVLGQQTVLTDLRLPNGAILNYDQWDGYAPARDRLLAAARRWPSGSSC